MPEPTGWSFDAGISPIKGEGGGDRDDSSLLGSLAHVRKAARGDLQPACSVMLQQLVATAAKNTSEQGGSSDELQADASILDDAQLKAIQDELRKEQLLAEAARREARALDLQGMLVETRAKAVASSAGSRAGRKSQRPKSEPEREKSNFSRDLSAMIEDDKAAEIEAARYRETTQHEEVIARLTKENDLLRTAGRQELQQAHDFIAQQSLEQTAANSEM